MSALASLALLLALASPSRALPQQVEFWNAREGFGLFWRCAGSCHSELRTTDNGGRNWQFVRAAPRFGSLVVAPGGSAWIGRLMSTDRGHSWRSLPSKHYSALAFSDGERGWGIDFLSSNGSSQHLVRSSSGGRSWTPTRNPCERSHESIVDLSAPTPDTAWALCSGLYGAGNDAKAIYATRDGGLHWALVNQSDFRGSPRKNVGSGLPVYGYVDGIEMTASGRGWLWESRGWAFRSRNGGRHWQRVGLTTAEEREARSISFPSNSVGFMLIQDYARREYRLDRTRNGGRSWAVVRRWSTRRIAPRAPRSSAESSQRIR